MTNPFDANEGLYYFQPILPVGYYADEWLLPQIAVMIGLTPGDEEITATSITTYDGLQAAMSEVGTTATVTLSDVINGTATLFVNGNKTLDLNGHTLTIIVSSGNGIKINTGAALTIKDSGSTGTLNVTNTVFGAGTGEGAAINTTDGTLTIESGTVNATGGTYGAGIGGGRVAAAARSTSAAARSTPPAATAARVLAADILAVRVHLIWTAAPWCMLQV